MKNLNYLFSILLLLPFAIFAQESSEENVEEIVVVGSQIKGASITGALPVTVISSEDIDILGVEDGTELLENMTEQGLNYFTEAESDSGGVNSARGDVGAYNIRNMGVGNTLILLNGRRLVNNAGYQTELLGGDYVPTMSVNSNLIPTMGLDRVEVLKDGASAIYGADAVAGVVNNVLKTDYEGFEIALRNQGYDNFSAVDDRITLKWGKDMNGGKTNISLMYDFYDRDGIAAAEDPRWGDSDHRKWIPADSLWAGDTSFRNLYSGKWAQLDMRGRTGYSDSAGEMQIIPIADPRCARSDSKDTGYGTCLAVDTTSMANGEYYINPGQFRDYRGELERSNLFVFVNHELDGGAEFFAEIGSYNSEYMRNKEPAGDFSTALLELGPNYYWANAIGLSADNSSSNKAVRIDNWRPDIGPRIINVEKETYRYLFGFRGTMDSGWDWETAVLHSKAISEDLTENRLSNSLLQAGLNDSTSSAINIFSADVKTALAPAIVDVSRNDTSELNTFDFKMTNPEVFNMPAGPVGMLVGFEYRSESYSDDRDPRLDGTIQFQSAVTGLGFPFVGDVLGSSPTVDTSAKRSTNSVFAEMIMPLTNKMEAQFAMRHEDPDDTKSSTVWKAALGWEIANDVLLRGSKSTSFRVPNLIQANQLYVTRSGNVDDAVGEFVGANDPLDDRYQIQSYRIGNPELLPEESDNTSWGFVWTPSNIEGLTVTWDDWRIEKDNTIVLFGRTNAMVADLVARINYGPDNCGGYSNPAIIRDQNPGYTSAEIANFAAAGICPAGEAFTIYDEYTNAATRSIAGQDIGIYYDISTEVGDFNITVNHSETTEFEQKPTNAYQALVDAQASGVIPFDITFAGFGNLAGLDGNYVEKTSVKFNYRVGDLGVQLSSLRKGEFYHSSETRSDGTRYVIPSMTTVNASVYYWFDIGDQKARVKFAVKNLEDERAPLADRFYGFFADAHQDYGRNFYLDIKVKF
jgi:outer membrane receptor for ferrienterochelin and colicin